MQGVTSASNFAAGVPCGDEVVDGNGAPRESILVGLGPCSRRDTTGRRAPESFDPERLYHGADSGRRARRRQLKPFHDGPGATSSRTFRARAVVALAVVDVVAKPFRDVQRAGVT